MRDVLVDRGVEPQRITLVHNWVDESLMRPVPRDHQLRRSWGAGEDDLVVLYAGTMGPAQDLGTLVSAMERLRDRPDVHLVLVGDGIAKDALREQVARAGLTSVSVHDPVPVAEVPSLIASADLNVVALADEPLFRVTMPSKLQAILACGGAVLAVAPGDAANVVVASGAGRAARPGDVDGVATTLTEIADAPRSHLAALRRAARSYYDSVLSETINADVLARVLEDAAGQGRAAS
jgi:glycosyltransferase involved in cell wall biosynthesis